MPLPCHLPASPPSCPTTYCAEQVQCVFIEHLHRDCVQSSYTIQPVPSPGWVSDSCACVSDIAAPDHSNTLQSAACVVPWQPRHRPAVWTSAYFLGFGLLAALFLFVFRRRQRGVEVDCSEGSAWPIAELHQHRDCLAVSNLMHSCQNLQGNVCSRTQTW